MRILLDTHAWLWMIGDPDRLGVHARALVRAPDHVLLLSAASTWEIVIKHALGRLDLPEPPASFVPEQMRASAVTALAIEHSHALGVGELPAQHRDPFDRMLAAQARIEQVPLLTADPVFARYGTEVVDARS